MAANEVASEVMLLVSDGPSDNGCDPVRSAARRAKGQGVRIISICVGGACDAPCLRACASSHRDYFQIGNPTDLVAVFDQARPSILQLLMRFVSLTVSLPPGTEYLTGPADPPTTVSDDRRTLTWEYSFIPPPGIQASFNLRPQSAGPQHAIERATAQFSDARLQLGLATFPPPSITVFRLGALAPLSDLSLKIPHRLSAKAAQHGY